jgi:hypothetical protein
LTKIISVEVGTLLKSKIKVGQSALILFDIQIPETRTAKDQTQRFTLNLTEGKHDDPRRIPNQLPNSFTYQGAI